MKAPFRLALAGQARVAREKRGSGIAGFQPILEEIRGADLAFTNFENTILGGHGGFPVKNGYRVPPGPEVLEALRWMGFGALSLANNHAFDLGPAGILSTLEETAARGFMTAGTGTDAASASAAGFADLPSGRVALVAMDASPQPDFFYARDPADGNPARPGINRLLVRQSLAVSEADFRSLGEISRETGDDLRKAEKAKVGFGSPPSESGSGVLDFYGLRVERASSAGEIRTVDPGDRERQLATIRDARARADLVIVYLHHHLWSPRWEEVPAWTRAFARDCVDAGASVFVSHGVPVLQGIELYHGAPILYSLGNFVFHSHREATRSNDWIWKSVVATATFDEGYAFRDMTLMPIVLGGGRALADPGLDRDIPELAEGWHADGILGRISSLSRELGTDIHVDGGRGLLRS
ncbi:MAG: CapA family protein [Spirochaetota bacterium]